MIYIQYNKNDNRGISSHDAALAVVKDRQLVFASNERYSRIKNDKYLNVRLLHEALVMSPYMLHEQP